MKNYYIPLVVLLLVITTLPLMAQGGPPATPIDGGLSVLLVAGGIYGFKKLKNYTNCN